MCCRRRRVDTRSLTAKTIRVFTTWFIQVLGRSLGRLNTVAHFEELEEVLDWVAADRGNSIVPAACAVDHEQRGEIVAIRKPGITCQNTIYAVLDSERCHPAVERTLAAVKTRTSICD
ncbi:LysR substrate-binding domain-containing protein [Dyella subtropica]|uniref:LysR substrate-binding domain-containing protein n=1 Tax=Dyella subtropica TaxID=2992127 RepID=UPI002B1CC313|nr:LysR substrate-binding domain-containing protein [Dyella subtropica]